MKVCGAAVTNLITLGFTLEQSTLREILEDLLLKNEETIYIISASEITDLNKQEVIDSIRAKVQNKVVIVITQNEQQQERVKEIAEMHVDGVNVLKATNDVLLKDSIKMIINNNIMKLSTQIKTYSDEEEYTEVPIDSVSLPFKFTQGKLLPENNPELLGYKRDSLSATTNDEALSEYETQDPNPIAEEDRIVEDILPEEARKMVYDTVEVTDIEKIQEDIDINKIMANLEADNMSYASLKTTLDEINSQLDAIVCDRSIYGTDKFNRLKPYLDEKIKTRTALEHIEVRQVIDIMKKVEKITRDEVDRIVSIAENKYADQKMLQMYQTNVSEMDAILKECAKERMKFNDILNSIKKTLIAIDKTKVDMLENIITPDITNSYIVNENIKSAFNNGISYDAKLLMISLIEVAAEVENGMNLTINKFKKAIESIYNMNQLYESYANKAMFNNKILTVNRIEQAIKVDSPTKAALRLIVGKSNSGKTATAHIFTKLKSREVNACVIDLADQSKLHIYTPVSPLSRFIDDYEKIPSVDYLAIYKDTEACSLSDIKNLINELATKFKYITIVMSNEQREAFDFFANDALSVAFLVDDTQDTVEKMGKYTDGLHLPNTAIIALNMFTELSNLELSEIYNLDVTLTKVIDIPRMANVSRSTLGNLDPTTFEDVKTAYERVL